MHGLLWNYWGSASLLVCLASGKELQMLQVSDHPGTSAVKRTARCDCGAGVMECRSGHTRLEQTVLCSFC